MDAPISGDTWLRESSILTREALFSAICGPLTHPMNTSALQFLLILVMCPPLYLLLRSMRGRRAIDPNAMCAVGRVGMLGMWQIW